jgi:hypothetical protein
LSPIGEAAPSEYFRLCIAWTDEHEIREGVGRLGRALRGQGRPVDGLLTYIAEQIEDGTGGNRTAGLTCLDGWPNIPAL